MKAKTTLAPGSVSKVARPSVVPAYLDSGYALATTRARVTVDEVEA